MSADDNVKTVLGSIDVVFNQGLLDRIPEFYSPEFKSHQGGYGLMTWEPGWDGLHKHVAEIRRMWPDYHEDVEIIFGSGELVSVRMTLTGTSREDGALPKNGKSFKVKDMMICRVVDNKLVEQWGLTDNYSRLIELGHIDPVV
ncbi:MAG: ester cyclase [Paracoccaceae bacterium]|nr:ester cyclase [Paracoccaceae bacterium]